MAKHYCYGSGMFGCLYDYGPNFCETKDGAINSLLWTFAHLRKMEIILMRRALETDGIYRFRNPQEAGAQYCEITEQPGECPEQDDE